VVICIENPRVPAAAPRVAIPGRGTTYKEALIRNGRGFFDFGGWKHTHTLTCPCGCAARCNPGSGTII